MNLQALAKPLDRHWGKTALFLSGLALLLGSWYALFVWLLAVTDAWLTPWKIGSGPPLGSWARAANDFFETDLGALLPGVGFIMISMGLFIYRIWRAKHDQAVLPWFFAGANVIFLAFFLALESFERELVNLWFSEALESKTGYQQVWPLIVILVALLTDLVVIQGQLKVHSGQVIIERQRGVLVLLGVEGAIIGGWLMWFWVIRDGLAWLDRLFYPYTALIMIGIPIAVLIVMMVGSWLMSRPYPQVGEDYEGY